MVDSDAFKKLIVEFWEERLPEVRTRELKVPLGKRKAIVVWGPRRVGKSYYLFSLIKKLRQEGLKKEQIVYLNFEDDRLGRIGEKELSFLYEAYLELVGEISFPVYFFLDELQVVEGWERFVRRLIEREKVYVFLTGSSSKLTSKEIATSLRGRSLSFFLPPLNFREFLEFKGVEVDSKALYGRRRFLFFKLFEEYLEWGRFPEIVLEKEEFLKRRILADYFDALVYKDFVERYRIEREEFLREFLVHLFNYSGKLFSASSFYKSVGKNLGVGKNTVFEYFEKVKESFYLYFLPVFSYSEKAKWVNPKKVIALDNGLKKVVSREFTEDRGRKLENLAGSLLTELEFNSIDVRVFYWKGKQEVDFVLERKGELTAINVSFTDELLEREISSLEEFSEKFPRAKRLLLITKNKEGKKGRIELIPVLKFFLEFPKGLL